MSLTGALSGRVLGLAPGALVGLARTPTPLSWRHAVELGADNLYRFDGLPPGRLPGERRRRAPRGRRGRRSVPAEAPTLDLQPPPPPPPPPTLSVIHGLVQYVSGGPLAGAEVELHHDGLLETQTLSDSEGEFEFRDLGARHLQCASAGILGVVHRDPEWPG